MKNFDVYVDLYPNKEKSSLQSSLTDSDGLNKLDKTEIDQHKTEVDKHMEKSVLKPGFEKAEKAPTMLKSRRLLKKERKIEAEKTKGKQWYNLPATEMTEEKLRDLEVIQMRSILNPKQFYKKNDMKVVPKYFQVKFISDICKLHYNAHLFVAQVGTVVDSAADFYHDRIPKKQRKKTLVDELMADANFQRYFSFYKNELFTLIVAKFRYNKQKYAEIIKTQPSNGPPPSKKSK